MDRAILGSQLPEGRSAGAGAGGTEKGETADDTPSPRPHFLIGKLSILLTIKAKLLPTVANQLGEYTDENLYNWLH